MLEKFSSGAQRIISIAEALAFEFNHPTVGSEHLLLSFLKLGDNILSKELLKYKIDYYSFYPIIQNLYQEQDNTNLYVQYTFELKELLTDSIKLSDKSKESLVSVDTLALSLISNKNVAQELLIKNKVNLSIITKAINNTKKKKSELTTIQDLHLMGVNVLNPLIGRESELKQLINALSRRNKPNAILLGEPGVGKSAIVEELARLVLDNKIPLLKGKTIYELDIASTVAGTKYRGEFEEKIKKIIKKVHEDGNAILFIDEIHTIVKAGGAEGAIDAANILKPYLSRGEIQIIGATTQEEFNATFEKDKALKRRFQLIRINESTKEETLDILEKIKPIYEKHYRIKIDNYLLKDIVELCDRHLLNLKFPDKAIDVLDNSCVIAKSHLTSENIKETFEVFYKINIGNRKIESLEQKLLNEVVGQERAIEQIVDEFEIIDKLQSPKNDIVKVFLFNGPSGCGKSLCANIIASYYQKTNPIIINLNCYKDLNGLNKLINGSSNTYLEAVSPLVKGLNDNPSSFVIIEEFDKGLNEIKDFFLDVFDKGYFYDNRGNKVNCKNAVFILISSVFDNNYKTFKGYLTSEKHEENNVELEKILGPSLISRITKIITFEKFDKESIKTLMRKYIETMSLEVGSIEEALNLSTIEEYDKSGARLAYKNVRKKLLEQEKIKKQIKNG